MSTTTIQKHNLPLYRLTLVSLALLFALLLGPSPALADAPITRGPETQSLGSVGVPPSGAGRAANDTVWRDVQELPPLTLPPHGPATTPNFAPIRQQGGGGSSAITWLARSLNPGNWILDAGMGIFAGIIKMFGGIMQKAGEAFLGTASVLPAGCDNAVTNFVFCTPASLTYDHPGVRTVWGVLSGIAAGLVTILFTVRLGRMIVEGPRALATEGKGLLLTFIVAMAFIQSTYSISWLIIEFFNGISNLLLSRASLVLPSQDVGDLNIGSNILFLVLWILILLLTIKSFRRIVQIIILLACAPLAGALLMDRATSSRFRSWFEKLIELLLSQVNLVIIFIVITAILQPYAGRGAGDAFVSTLLSIVMMGMALSGKSAIGFAGAALSGGGGGIMSFLRYQLVGNLLRSAAGGRGHGGRTVGTSSTTDPQVREAADAAQRAAQESRERSAHASGDPSQSTAARRQSEAPPPSNSAHPAPTGPAPAGSSQRGDPSQSVAARRQSEARPTSNGTRPAPTGPAPAGSFRVEAAGDSLASRRAFARYQAAGQASSDAAGRQPVDARREQARTRATMMRRRAGGLRAAGDRDGADALERKARLHDRFGRGQDIARPSRFTPDERATRQRTYRQALAETTGMHALERDTLTQQIAADEARLPTLERDVALTGSTGGGTTMLHQEQQAITQRLTASRARLQQISPRQDGAPSRATREAATALANERLEPALRSSTYKARISAGSGSAFARRITGGPSQRARDELARTRAHAVRVAQTPPEQRAPIAPIERARRRSADKLAGERPAASQSASNGQVDAPPQGQSAPPTRARSSTIQHLQQQIRRDTPRSPQRSDEPADTTLAPERIRRFAPRRRTRRELPEDER